MAAGYLYVLQNNSFGDYVVKIGLTTREPDVRAREIYAGATGIPEPFDVAFACHVADCSAAETEVHARLATYRINRRREFFQISPPVARRVVLDTCKHVNTSLGFPDSPPILIDKLGTITSDSEFHNGEDEPAALSNEPIEIEIAHLTPLPVGTSSLNASQLDRVLILSMIFDAVFPRPANHWQQTFSRDRNPETEILIWEHIAKAFLKIDQIRYLDQPHKKEAFALLLMRSMMPTHKAIKAASPKLFTEKVARHILDGYELPPKPISVSFL